ncbi:MAG: hypothetical protein CMP98_10885 [Gammaproteobacteria bacterium]|nr:hypothetical protein [Gammaproteobacteria bacterium]OUU08499.1 MAG: hypothetical protein CBB94_11125 [Gammaproteobacteria bacterium TMED34]
MRFCGQVNEQLSKQLAAKARNIKTSQISVSLDVGSYFGNTWTGPERTAQDIMYLHQRLGAANESAINRTCPCTQVLKHHHH